MKNKYRILQQIGRQGRINIEANKKLKDIYQNNSITECEICGGIFGLSWHHRHRRSYYYDKPELLSRLNQTLLLDLKCHQMVECSNEKHKYYFNKLRGKEV